MKFFCMTKQKEGEGEVGELPKPQSVNARLPSTDILIILIDMTRHFYPGFLKWMQSVSEKYQTYQNGPKSIPSI